MKKIPFLILPIGLLLSCSVFNLSLGRKEFLGCKSKLDSTLVEFRKSKKIYVFELNPSDTMGNKRICAYTVSKELNMEGDYYKHVTEFLLSDTTLYDADYIPVKQPFYPTLAFKPNKKNALSCLISFGTEEIAFSYDDSTYVSYRLNSINELRRLRDEILCTDSLKRK